MKGEAPVGGTVEIRPLRSHAEFDLAVELQQRVWGFADKELLPRRLFVVASQIGGQVLGAFAGERLGGFLLALPALKPGGLIYLHSHMLGVLPEFRNCGIGRRLKLAQRMDALGRGIRLVEWTFDPCELKNAYFNIRRLGAIVRRFVPNQYGYTSSPLHAGLPTDRCIAEWYVASRRVEQHLAGQPQDLPWEEEIEVPARIHEIRRTDPTQAQAIQKEIARRFSECFRRGLYVTGFDWNSVAGIYRLSLWKSESIA